MKANFAGLCNSRTSFICSSSFRGLYRCKLTTMAEGAAPEFALVKEGKAEIFQPVSVFYNKVQEFNRDLR